MLGPVLIVPNGKIKLWIIYMPRSRRIQRIVHGTSAPNMHCGAIQGDGATIPAFLSSEKRPKPPNKPFQMRLLEFVERRLREQDFMPDQ